MSLTAEDVKKIAHLARLNLPAEEIANYTEQLSNILNFVKQMDQASLIETAIFAHPLDIAQRLRPDQVTEHDQREQFQQIAPQTAAGLYLVPKVIE